MSRDPRNVRRRLAYHLRQAMRAAMTRPMRWGVDDCALWHADVDRAVFDRDPASPWRGRYRTAQGAQRVLGPRGLAGALAAQARAFGWEKVQPERARVGDLGLIVSPQGCSVVRCLHPGEWVGRNETGFSVVPTEAVRVAWAVTA